MFLILLTCLIHMSVSAQNRWLQTPDGLPYYEYDSSASADEPCFILGNYRLNLFTHVNGIYELISGERVWARFNADPLRPGYGNNRAQIQSGKVIYELAGDNSLAADPKKCNVISGIGFTRYDYTLDYGLQCSRMISVMPSEEVNQGNPCFLLTVTLRNNGKRTRTLSYDEIVCPGFVPIYSSDEDEADRAFAYPFRTVVSFRSATALFSALPQQFFRSYSKDAPFLHEADPKPLFVYSPDAFLSIYDGEIHAKMKDLTLRAGAVVKFNIVIGVSEKDVRRCSVEMLSKAKDGQFGAYADMWKKQLPDFSSEADLAVRSELYWNAHTMEASAMYDEFFGETYVPAGSDATYTMGADVSNADHIEASLAASHTNPELAKSIIRYVMGHTDSTGDIASGNAGYGFAIPSDNYDVRLQIRVLYALAEYLRVTGDHSFLDERIELYPKEGRYATVMELVEKYFMRLRDLPSYQKRDNSVIQTECAMLAACLPVLVSEFKESRRVSSGFVSDLEEYGKANETRFLSGFTMPSSNAVYDIALYSYYLQMNSIPVSDRRDCYHVLDGIDWIDLELEYPLVLGLSSFDKIEAMKLYRKLSYESFNKNHPELWDVWHSDKFSARHHYWPLYLYARINE